MRSYYESKYKRQWNQKMFLWTKGAGTIACLGCDYLENRKEEGGKKEGLRVEENYMKTMSRIYRA